MKSNNMKRGTNNFVIQIAPNCSIFPHVLHPISDVPACQQSPYTGQLHYQMALLLVHLLTLCLSLGKFLCGYSSQKPPGEDIPQKPCLYQPGGQMALGFCQQGRHHGHHGHHGLYESLNWLWTDMLKTDGSPSQVTGGLIDQWASG